MKIDRVHTQERVYFLDTYFLEIQEHLADKLQWLDHAFGKSQMMMTDSSKAKKYPSIYVSERQGYVNLLPNSELGNYFFAKIEDPQTVNGERLKFKGSLIFWVDRRKIDIKIPDYSKELLKSQILKAIQSIRFSSGRLKADKIYESAQNIYNGYDYSETKDQFLMAPYYGLRIECSMEYFEKC